MKTLDPDHLAPKQLFKVAEDSDDFCFSFSHGSSLVLACVFAFVLVLVLVHVLVIASLVKAGLKESRVSLYILLIVDFISHTPDLPCQLLLYFQMIPRRNLSGFRLDFL